MNEKIYTKLNASGYPSGLKPQSKRTDSFLKTSKNLRFVFVLKVPSLPIGKWNSGLCKTLLPMTRCRENKRWCLRTQSLFALSLPHFSSRRMHCNFFSFNTGCLHRLGRNGFHFYKKRIETQKNGRKISELISINK